MKTKITITIDQICSLLDDKYYLYYVDRGDSLDGRLQELQETIQDPESHTLWETVFEHWWGELDYAKSELIKSMVDTFDIEEDEAQELWDEHEDHLRDIIYDRDASTPIQDLLRNTGDQAMFYSTGIEVGDWSMNADEKLKDLKEELKITTDEQDDDFHTMLSQASYGGEVVIYFTGILTDWVNHNDLDMQGNLITFRGCYIAIIDTGNGSGDHMWFGGNISLPFKRDHVFICANIGYSYTHKVCGMSNSWCEDTAYTITEELLVPKLEKSSIASTEKQKAKYATIYKEGGCTFGDMDITRHRKTSYENGYPAGTKCADCGTFWID